jgi:hypothetical protein
MIEPAIYNFTIIQGADFSRDLSIDRNLSGYTVRAQGRETWASTSTVFSSSTTANHLTIASSTATQSVIEWRIPAATTAGISTLEGVWDMEIVSGSGAVDRILKGSFYTDREVTR